MNDNQFDVKESKRQNEISLDEEGIQRMEEEWIIK